mgnify:CR=1 FL=1
MGGFWAYESLSFGGYWAWDPVENASLVPWLLLISGIHLMLIKKVTNSSTIASYTLVISSYIMVLYATFLTRSGVLGETSVHSFTDLGLAGQLMQFVVLFIWLPIIAVTESASKRWYIIIPVSILVLALPFYTKISFYPLLILSILGLGWFVLNLNKNIKNHASEDNILGKKIFLEDSQYYIEEVRKKVINDLTYEKVYKQGFNINTPINLELQKIANQSLRYGLISYDKRNGWRGPITNKDFSKKWYKDLEKYELEESISWEIAIVKKIEQFSVDIETKDKTKGVIEYKDISWTKKEFNQLLKVGY